FTMVGVCLESFDGRIRSTMPPVNVCTPAQWTYNEIPIPHDAGDDVATINPLPQPTFACYSATPPLDVVMILDKSGSMQITDLGVSNSRIAQLHDSVGTFLDTWSALSPPSDNVGVVTFDTTASVRTPLEDVATNSAAIKTDVANNVGPGRSTSVGRGFNTAKSLLGPQAGRRQVALLLTDVQQHTDPFVEFRNATTRNPELYCQNSASPQCTIPATCTLGSPCPLSNLPQTYTVTLGPSSTLNPAIDQQIANATLGFYLNNEANPSLLQPFFLQLLQNFVRFNSYETVRLISAKTSQATRYSTSLPVSGTSHDVVFSLMWSKQLGALRLTVTPPGGARPI